MTDIQTWLEAHGLSKYAQAFVAQDIGVDVLPELSEADLKELGVASLGDRKRLLKAMAMGWVPGDAKGPVDQASGRLAAAMSAAAPLPVTTVTANPHDSRAATQRWS